MLKSGSDRRLAASGQIRPKIVRHWLIMDVLGCFSRVLGILYSLVALNNLSPRFLLYVVRVRRCCFLPYFFRISLSVLLLFVL